MENKKMQKTNYSRSDLLKLEPLKLHEYLTDNFTITIPDRLDSVEEVSRTAELISRATAYYSFLESMRVEANLKKTMLLKREAKLKYIDDTIKNSATNIIMMIKTRILNNMFNNTIQSQD